jgi:hypothetical protein
MLHHRVEMLRVGQVGVAEIQFGKGRALFAEQRARGDTHPVDELYQQLSARRRLQILDDMRLDASISDHCERVARRPAGGIMVDDNVHD